MYLSYHLNNIIIILVLTSIVEFIRLYKQVNNFKEYIDNLKKSTTLYSLYSAPLQVVNFLNISLEITKIDFLTIKYVL